MLMPSMTAIFDLIIYSVYSVQSFPLHSFLLCATAKFSNDKEEDSVALQKHRIKA